MLLGNGEIVMCAAGDVKTVSLQIILLVISDYAGFDYPSRED